jgi:hypothetical protein
MIRETERKVPSGYLMLVVNLLLQLATFYWLFKSIQAQSVPSLIAAVVVSLLVAILWAGFFMVHPNQARVLQLFGAYAGTQHEPGLRWANPFYTKKAVSTRVRNFESGKLKVNDLRGSPIAAVVVWKVVDTAEAIFEVDNYEEFVTIQSESALRNLSTTYPYEPHEGDGLALRSNPAEIAQALRKEIQDRLDKAGVNVAVIAARTQIVAGAVGMVRMALEQLKEEQVVDLDEERKAAMVGNLLTVLCSEEGAQPVLNTGSLYS